MFKSLYRLHQHLDRRQPEAVLTGRGVLVMLIIFLTEQLGAQALAVVPLYFGLNLGIMEINMIVNGGALLLMFLFFGGFFLENFKNAFKEFKAVYLWLPVACYFCTVIANLIVQMALAIARGEFQTTSNNAVVIQLLQQYPVQLILLTVLIAPITEEAVFRAALSRPMTISDKGWVRALGFVLSVFLFAFFHIYQFAFFAVDASGAVYLTFNLNEFISILVYVPMAISLAICSFFGKNFWCSVWCHMITNIIAVMLMFLTGNTLQ